LARSVAENVCAEGGLFAAIALTAILIALE